MDLKQKKPPNSCWAVLLVLVFFTLSYSPSLLLTLAQPEKCSQEQQREQPKGQ